MDGGGELIGEIRLDPADAFPLRRALRFALLGLEMDAEEDADMVRLYVQLGGDPANVK